MKKRLILPVGIILFALALGFLSRSLAEGDLLPLPGIRLLETLQSLICLGIFAFWGVSLKRRIIQREVSRFIVLVPILEIFWLIVRELRWHYVEDPLLFRILWYAYYIPILFIPLFILFVSWLLGKPEDAKLPRGILGLIFPTLLLLVIVLTNDLHQWVFVSPWLETGYTYGPGYVLILVWVLGLACATLILMCSRLGIKNLLSAPQALRSYAPLLPLFLELFYVLLYALRLPLIMGLLGDVALFHCLVFSAFLESCIYSGWILTNSRYLELFQAASGLQARITDKSGTVRYFSKGAGEAEEDPSPTSEQEGIRSFSIPVNGGFCVWREDLSDLIGLRDSLEAQQEELKERNELLLLEYDREKQHRIIEEQNRLYDLLQRMAGSRLKRIDHLIGLYEEAESKREKRLILAKIVVFCSFIKRRRDFLLSSYALKELPEESLRAALAESFRALALLEIRGGYLVDTGRSQVDGELLTRAYDFFEDVMEAVLDEAAYFNVRVVGMSGHLRCAILTDCTTGHRERLYAKYPELRIISEEKEGTEFILPLHSHV